MRIDARQTKRLRFMYLYTALGAGLLGLGVLLAPAWVVRQLGMPMQDDVVLSVLGSAYSGFALIALLGLRAPLRFAPVLLLQLTYKLLWLLAVFLPMAVHGEAPPYAWLFAVIFTTYVIGDLVAIPFRLLLSDAGVEGDRRAV